jgi:hypothetical protein
MQRAESRQEAADTRQATGNGQQIIDSRRETGANRQQKIDNRHKTEDGKRQTDKRQGCKEQ